MLDGFDRHDEGCECGDCNSIGKSYSAGLYKVSPFKLTALGESEVIERVYAPSETSAILKAKEVAKTNGWTIVEETE